MQQALLFYNVALQKSANSTCSATICQTGRLLLEYGFQEFSTLHTRRVFLYGRGWSLLPTRLAHKHPRAQGRPAHALPRLPHHSLRGNRGVYLAYDFGGAKGCAEALEVIIKGWVTASDFECQREIAAYSVLSRAKPCRGVPLPWTASAQHDPVCDVHALVLPKLGPTLEDLRELLPDKRFDALMVLTVGIQMIERYQDIHARGLIHNGIKPANICLSPRGSADPPDMLYAIDFGFSTTPDMASESPLPSGHRIDAIGNRRFMSVFAHHGISQSQRDDLESLAYLLSYLFHSSLPWDTPSGPNARGSSRSRSPNTAQKEQHQPHVWRIKMATPPSILFRHMDACFLEFWRDVKALAYAEVPDYDRMRARFVACLEEHETSGVPVEWWDIWGKWK